MIVDNGQDCWTQDDYDTILEFVEAKLWLFVQANATTHSPKQLIANIVQLSDSELHLLTGVHFLLSATVQQCIHQDVPALLRRLVQSSATTSMESNGMVRGHVDWNQTLKRRMTTGVNNPTLFVTRTAVKSYDSSETKALKFLLIQVQALCLEVLQTVPEQDAKPLQAEEKWKSSIGRLYRSCHHHLKNACLRDVLSEIKITDAVLERVRRSRNKRYESVYSSLRLYRKLLLQGDKETLRNCMAQAVLKPLSRDTLYEIYVLMTTMIEMENNGWQQEHLRLIGYGKGAIAQYRHQQTTAAIYYQTLPPIFAQNSLYTQLLRKYKLDVALRRPDLLLELTTDEPRYILLEVKRTSDKQYIVDSFYKVLGYLKDFEQCFTSSRMSNALLVVWECVENAADISDTIVLLDNSSLRPFLEQMIR